MSADASAPPAASKRHGAGASNRRLSILDRLLEEPFSFEFFQAVRLLELAGCSQTLAEAWPPANPVGEDFAPGSESVRFGAAAAQSFPGSEISMLTRPSANVRGAGERSPARMTVTFLGLTGPCGVLPQHYTQRLVDQLREDQGMREFFDVFNHRIISLFYRAWKKYHFPIAYEAEWRTGRRAGGSIPEKRELGDPFSYGMFGLVGLGTGGLRRRQEFPDEALLYYAGQFAHYPRTAVSLERMIGEYFGLPTEILQFIGQWMELRLADQTRLLPDGGLGNSRLGATAVAGERVWGIESKFRVRLGPLSYPEFRELIPGGRQLLTLSQFVRSYAGGDLDFDVQLVLRRDEVPACQLAKGGEAGPNLGWNSWLGAGAPLQHDADDAVFQVEGWPSR